MDEKGVTLSHKEIKRLEVMQMLEARQMTGAEAAQMLVLSER